MKNKKGYVILSVILLVVVMTPLILHGIFKVEWRKVPGKEHESLSSAQEELKKKESQQSGIQNSASTSILNQSDMIEFDYGYYPDDHWTEAQCGFYVTPSVTGQLVLSIYYPFEVTGNQVGHVFVDGQPCLDFTVTADNFEVNIPCQADKRMFVQINSDFAKEPGEEDKRALAFVLSGINQKTEKSMNDNEFVELEKENESKNQNALFSLLPESLIKGDGKFYEITEYNDQVVIDVGEKWDTLDVLNPSVLLFNGLYYNYYSGWDGKVWRTGIAISENGTDWVKQEHPVLDVRKEKWDNTYIAANGSAILCDSKVYYYYQGVDEANGYAQVGLAIAEDGINFTERTEQPVLTVGEDGEWDCRGVADPYVISFGGRYYMYYLGMDMNNVQRLGVAASDDGITWTKYQRNPIMDVGVHGAFDEMGLGEPSVIYVSPYFYMLYTGRNKLEQRNIGLAVSADGVNWKKMSYDGMFELPENSWDNQVICDTTLLRQEDGRVRVWYGGGNVADPDENLNGKIGTFEILFASTQQQTGFQPNMWNDEIDSRDFVHGSYEIEGEEDRSTWVSDNVAVVLQNDPLTDRIIIYGYVNMDLYKQIGVNKIDIDVLVNGVYCNTTEVADNGEIHIEIEKTKEMEKNIVLQIKTSSYINPKLHGIGEDERDLCWILKSIIQE